MLKKLLYILVAVIALSPMATKAHEQTFTGTPLVREGNEWCFFRHWDDEYYYQYIKGDTIINGIPYKKLYEKGLSLSHPNEYVNQPVAFMREDNGRVSVVKDTSHRNSCSSQSIYMNMVKGDYFDVNGECVLYDFNDINTFINEINEGLGADYYHLYVEPVVLDNVLVADRNCYRVSEIRTTYGETQPTHYGIYIEGIGWLGVNPHYFGDLLSFAYPNFPITSPRPELVYLKNANGDYEYLDEAIMYSGIEQIKPLELNVQVVDGRMSISFSEPVKSGFVDVIDLNGRVIASQAISGERAEISLERYAKGLYIVQVQANGYNQCQKVIL